MATRIVDDALLMVQSTGEGFNLAELHRVRALLLAGAGNAAEAEQTLWTSLEVARAKGAVFYELRTAIELARQLPDVARGREVLREAFSRLPEGAEGPEVEEARRILGGFLPP
jgi:predicted ATPase